MLFGGCFRYNLWLVIFMGMAKMNGKALGVNRAAGRYWRTIYVDQSGRGKFTTIQAAIDFVPWNNQNWIRIHVEAGIYREQVTIPPEKQFIYLTGRGKWKTSVVWDASQELDTSATFSVFADNFVARDISFVNSYNYPWKRGMLRNVAAAARVQGDKNSFYRCGFVGLQDTLWDSLGRHYFYRSSFVGAVDFIFGAGQSLYEGCTILFNGTALAGPGYITAQGRGSANDPSGFVFKNCVVYGTGWAYLGRPWRPYARVIFSHSSFSNIIVPAGWDSWNTQGDQLHQLTFTEDNCYGPGSDITHRISWESRLEPEQLKYFTSISFIDNEGWIGRQPYNMLAH